MNQPIQELKSRALTEIQLLKDEYKMIRKYAKSKRAQTFNGVPVDFMSLSDDQLEGLYKKRKDRKYAALVIELYAVVEQLLKDIYNAGGDAKYEHARGKNIIEDLENKLDATIRIPDKRSLKPLARLRKTIVHENFSLKQARVALQLKDSSLQLPDSNKELVSSLLNLTATYVGNIEVKQG